MRNTPASQLGLASLSADSGKRELRAARASAGELLSPAALKEIAQIEADVDRVEAATVQRIIENPGEGTEAIRLLGKALLYDKQLSVNRNEACAFCHMPEAGFTGPSSQLNRTTGA